MDFPISSMSYLGIVALNPNNIQNSELDLTFIPVWLHGSACAPFFTWALVDSMVSNLGLKTYWIGLSDPSALLIWVRMYAIDAGFCCLSHISGYDKPTSQTWAEMHYWGAWSDTTQGGNALIKKLWILFNIVEQDHIMTFFPLATSFILITVQFCSNPFLFLKQNRSFYKRKNTYRDHSKLLSHHGLWCRKTLSIPNSPFSRSLSF